MPLNHTDKSAKVVVTVADATTPNVTATVPATIDWSNWNATTGDGALWSALLDATATGGNYTILAKCTGCANQTAAIISNVVFGDGEHFRSEARSNLMLSCFWIY
jgi:hypothetical protein